MSTLIIQVCGCYLEDGEVTPFVTDDEASYYGVYIGKGGDFNWLADFRDKETALQFGQLLAGTYKAELSDRTSGGTTAALH